MIDVRGRSRAHCCAMERPRRQPFVSRHPLITVVIILAVELSLLGIFHVVLGWRDLAVALMGLAVLVLVSILMG